MAAERPPQTQFAELGQEPGGAHAFVADEAEEASVENDEKGEEGDRQGKVVRYPSRQQRDGDGEQHPDEELRTVKRRIEEFPARGRKRQIGLRHDLHAAGDEQKPGGGEEAADHRVRDEAEPLPELSAPMP